MKTIADRIIESYKNGMAFNQCLINAALKCKEENVDYNYECDVIYFDFEDEGKSLVFSTKKQTIRYFD